MIVIVDDVVAQEMRSSNTSDKSRGGGSQTAKNPPELWKEILRGAAAALPVVGSMILIEALVKAVGSLRERGIDVLTVGTTDALNLTFPPGHPRTSILYIGHPADARVYYTAAQFHRVTFEHKFSEAIELLMNLGATEISVEHIRGWKKDFASHLSVPLATSVAASAGVSVARQQGEHHLFKAALSAGRKPVLPDNLVWFPHEPTWKRIADGRLNHGLTDFELTVSYEDDFGVNIGLTTNAQRAGLDLGGKFEDHLNTVWQISGKFGDPS